MITENSEKIKVVESSNFHVTIVVDEPGVCINVKTLANHSHQDNNPKGLYIKFPNGSSEFTHN